MLTVIIVLLILIVLLLGEMVIMTAKAEARKERIPIREQIEDRKIQKERRAVERERSREATRNIDLMTKVEEYDGNIQ